MQQAGPARRPVEEHERDHRDQGRPGHRTPGRRGLRAVVVAVLVIDLHATADGGRSASHPAHTSSDKAEDRIQNGAIGQVCGEATRVRLPGGTASERRRGLLPGSAAHRGVKTARSRRAGPVPEGRQEGHWAQVCREFEAESGGGLASASATLDDAPAARDGAGATPAEAAAAAGAVGAPGRAE